MNPTQLAQQMKHLITRVKWPEGSQHVVFGPRNVSVFVGTPQEDQIPAGFPWAMVGIKSGDPDDDHPDLIEQQFELMTAVEVAGDPLGEHAVTGGAMADIGKSAGRGIGEVSERTRSAVQVLTGANAAPLTASSSSLDTPATIGRGRHIVMDSFTVTALCTSQPLYAAPQVIRHRDSRWEWEGLHVSRRYDFLQYRLVRKSGSDPSSSPSDGTVIYTGTDPFWGGVATSGNTYTVFADYNPRGAATVAGTSSPEVGSYLVVT